MKVYINSIAYYLPSKKVTNEDLAKQFPDWSVNKVMSKVGISSRAIAGTSETAKDMAIKAAKQLFKENALIKKESIDFVLLCTQSPDYSLPTSACIIQNELGLSTSCGALDFNLGCSGYVYGLSLAKGLVCAGIAKNVLLLTAETYSKYIDEEDKGNKSIFGDAASASLISHDGIGEILDFSLGTDGSGYSNLIVEKGASRNPLKEGEKPSLYMNGSEIFGFTLEAVPQLVSDVLRKNELNRDEIDLFVFHQANRHMMEFLRKKIDVALDKFYYYLENVGNTVSSTIPIALCEAQKENRLRGQILLAGFGVGYSWGSVIIKYK